MATEVLMPALSPTMTEGKIARWLKSEGDAVRSGDVLAEIETDKATMEVEAVDEGVLAKIVIPEGTDHVAVNTPIAVIAGNGEEVAASGQPAPGPAPNGHQQSSPEDGAEGEAATTGACRQQQQPPSERLHRPSPNIPAPRARLRCGRRYATLSPRKCGATKRCF